MKKLIRLTESDLRKIIKESVNRILKEGEYSMPNSVFDKYAYDYDNALANANSLEDWDKMMADRENDSKLVGDLALNLHPARDRGYRLNMYTPPEWYKPWYEKSDEETLADIEDGVKASKELYGFPTD